MKRIPLRAADSSIVAYALVDDIDYEEEFTWRPHQDAEYAAWTSWLPTSPPDKRDAHCHGFDAGVRFARRCVDPTAIEAAADAVDRERDTVSCKRIAHAVIAAYNNNLAEREGTDDRT
jgi:hypothetical protein